MELQTKLARGWQSVMFLDKSPISAVWGRKSELSVLLVMLEKVSLRIKQINKSHFAHQLGMFNDTQTMDTSSTVPTSLRQMGYVKSLWLNRTLQAPYTRLPETTTLSVRRKQVSKMQRQLPSEMHLVLHLLTAGSTRIVKRGTLSQLHWREWKNTRRTGIWQIVKERERWNKGKLTGFNKIKMLAMNNCVLFILLWLIFLNAL